MSSSARTSTRTRKKTQRLQDSQDPPPSAVQSLVGPSSDGFGIDEIPPLPPLPKQREYNLDYHRDKKRSELMQESDSHALSVHLTLSSITRPICLFLFSLDSLLNHLWNSFLHPNTIFYRKQSTLLATTLSSTRTRTSETFGNSPKTNWTIQ